MRTNANTNGAACFIWPLTSFCFAVLPVTPTSTPSILPTVAGTTVRRSVCNAASALSSTPSPCIAIETTAIVPSAE